MIMIDTYRPGSFSVLIDRDKDRELIVCIAPDHWRHGESSYARSAHRRMSAFIVRPRQVARSKAEESRRACAEAVPSKRSCMYMETMMLEGFR